MNEFIKVSNVAPLLRNAKGGWGVTPKRVYQIIKEGKLRPTIIDGVCFISRDQILNYTKPKLGRPRKPAQ